MFMRMYVSACVYVCLLFSELAYIVVLFVVEATLTNHTLFFLEISFILINQNLHPRYKIVQTEDVDNE